MKDGPLSIVILGLSITSSWGNGHATTYRGLVRELAARGHDDAVPRARYAVVCAASRPAQSARLPARALRIADRAEGTLRPGRERRRRGHRRLLRSGRNRRRRMGAANGRRTRRPFTISTRRSPSPRSSAAIAHTSRASSFPATICICPSPAGRRWRGWKRSSVRPVRRRFIARSIPRIISRSTSLRAGTSVTSAPTAPTVSRAWRGSCSRPPPRFAQASFVVAGPQYPPEIAWPENVARIEHLPPAEHRGFYNQQRFTLNLTRADMMRRGLVAERALFEAAACGTPIISDWWPGLDSLLEPGAGNPHRAATPRTCCASCATCPKNAPPRDRRECAAPHPERAHRRPPRGGTRGASARGLPGGAVGAERQDAMSHEDVAMRGGKITLGDRGAGNEQN